MLLASIDPELVQFFAIATMVGTLIVHIVFALAVFSDSPPRQVLCGRACWILATLVGGVFVAAAYWILHHGITLHSPILHTRPDEAPEPNLR